MPLAPAPSREELAGTECRLASVPRVAVAEVARKILSGKIVRNLLVVHELTHALTWSAVVGCLVKRSLRSVAFVETRVTGIAAFDGSAVNGFRLRLAD